MEISKTYLVQYRKPYTKKGRIVKLYKTKSKRYFLDDNETVEEVDAQFANELKQTPL